MFKILAIDGGGIRGLIPAVLLEYIEQETEKPVSKLFDLIVGTSTGGILAAGLTVPKGRSKIPKFKATDLLEFYQNHGAEIFSRSLWDGLSSGWGLTDALYDEKPLEKLLSKYMGTATLTSCLKPIVLTSYDIERREPYFFKTSRARQSADRNHYLRDATRATSAAPTFFEPEIVPGKAKKSTRRVLVDGGVFVNNPSMCAFAEACKTHKKKPEDMVMVSLGTGVATRKLPYDEAKDWGKLEWIRPLISVMMDGQADAADYYLNQLMHGAGSGNKQRYFRFDTKLKTALDDIDAAHTANIAALKTEANRIITDKATEFAHLFTLLKKSN